MNVSLTVFQGRAGDHNDLAIPGAKSIALLLSRQLGLEATVVGTPEPALSTHWRTELDVAMPALRAMQGRFQRIFSLELKSVAATSRCGVSLATLPVVAKYRNDACVVWFDAHADLNTPESSTTGFLGGLALSGPVGLWDSGLGAGLALENVVLVGQRDMDRYEIELIHSRRVRCVEPRSNLSTALSRAIAGRPVYVHLDCDVLNPGIVPTDYAHEGGLSLEDLRVACEVIAQGEVIGIEIAEFQNSWSSNGIPVSPAPLIEALRPILKMMRSA